MSRTHTESKQLKESVIALYEDGASMQAIATEEGISPTYVRYILIAAGVTLRADSRGNKLKEETVKAIISDYENTPKTMTTIAQAYKVSLNTIYAILTSHGIQTRRQVAASAMEDKLESAAQQYMDGARLWSIFDNTGVSWANLRVWLYRKHIPLRSDPEPVDDDNLVRSDPVP